MPTDEIQFYLRHREQITEWAKLAKRAEDLMRDAVKQGAQDEAIQLLNGESGDEEVDFYVRNRLLIAEWDAWQTLAGNALHAALLTSAQQAGLHTDERKLGFTTVHAGSPGLDRLRADHPLTIELGWTKQHLLSTGRGYSFPRLALSLPPAEWTEENRDTVVKATRPVAHELGMKKKANWWVHWCMLDPIAASQDLQTYAASCIVRLQAASERLYPVLRDAIASAAQEDPA